MASQARKDVEDYLDVVLRLGNARCKDWISDVLKGLGKSSESTTAVDLENRTGGSLRIVGSRS